MYIFQISDLHFQIENERSINNLKKIVENIRRQDVKPDILLISGDITHQQDYTSYHPVFELLKPLNVPIFCITGNNDSSAGLMKALKEYLPAHPQSQMKNALQYVVDDYPFRLIALDSFAPNQMSGEMDAERLDWFKAQLGNNPERKPVLVMVHQFTLANTLHRGTAPWFKEFNGLVVAHADTVRLVASGHVHALLSGNLSSVRFISDYSVNWDSILDFKNHGNQIRDDNLPVGYLIHHYDGADFLTYAVAIS